MTAATVLSSSRYAVPATPRVRRFTVAEYHRLIEEGFFAHDERFELLEGWIVAKASRNPVHDAAISVVRRILDNRVPDGWHVRIQSGFTTTDSEPEPDLAVVRVNDRDYTQRHPGPGDTALVVEVANTTLLDDREIKGRLYARAGVGVFWIVNLNDRVIEVYTDPSGPTPSPSYATRCDFAVADSVILVCPGSAPISIPVTELMP